METNLRRHPLHQGGRIPDASVARTIIIVSSIARKDQRCPMTHMRRQSSLGSRMRSSFAGDEAVRRTRRNCRTRDYRHADGPSDQSLPKSAIYPHTKRIAALFAASLAAGAATPEIVGINPRGYRDRNFGSYAMASPDAGAFLGWRASLSDEQWVDWGALDDDDWAAVVTSNATSAWM